MAGRDVFCSIFKNLAILPLLSAEFKEPGYVLLDEALARGQSKSVKKEVPGGEATKELFDRLETVTVKVYPSVGLGEDLRLSAKELTGSCLVVDGKVIHLLFLQQQRK